MCSSPDIEAPAPPPKAPPVLEQIAPKSAKQDRNPTQQKAKGLSRYKTGNSSDASRRTGLGGIPKKTGV